MTQNKLFVLDTNVLMHDPTCLFRFHEHDIYLPMAVLEELDGGKKGVSEVARNVRQVSRFIDELMARADGGPIAEGLPLDNGPLQPNIERPSSGRLFFETEAESETLPSTLPGLKPDNHILGNVLTLKRRFPERAIVLVSKDINLRIKAAVLGVQAEDYHNDQVLDDVTLLYSGTTALSNNFWEHHAKSLDSWQEEGRTFYRVVGPEPHSWFPNQCLFLPEQPSFEAIVRELNEDGSAIIELADDYARNSVWGINALNREQNFALNLLMDPEIDFVSLVGSAGTGKTLLALAAGLAQTLEENRYREIIMTRVTIPVAEDIGYLPGTEEEKMTPWMGALMDNLEVLTKSDSGSWGRGATNDLLLNRIKIRSTNFMRGRTFQSKYLIIDEAQNMTAKQMKTMVTRAGPGTKVVCLGNVGQIDTPYLTETSSGLTYVVDHFKNWPHSGHITLTRGERSRLADYASDIL